MLPAIRALSPYLYWPGTSSPGVLFDASGNGRTGTSSGGPAGGGIARVPGIRMDGINDRVDSSSANTNSSRTVFCVFTLLKLNSATPVTVWTKTNRAGAANTSATISTDGYFQITEYDNAAGAYYKATGKVAGALIRPLRPTVLTGRYDQTGNSLDAFVDGVKVATQAIASFAGDNYSGLYCLGGNDGFVANTPTGGTGYTTTTWPWAVFNHFAVVHSAVADATVIATQKAMMAWVRSIRRPVAA